MKPKSPKKFNQKNQDMDNPKGWGVITFRDQRTGRPEDHGIKQTGDQKTRRPRHQGSNDQDQINR